MTDKVEDKKILDACCGGRMFWENKQNPKVLFMDIREFKDTLCDGREFEVKPDIVADFRDMPFPDNSFYHVVFDPPHLFKLGQNSWMAKKYGRLNKTTWKEDIKQGFDECIRVLKPNGILTFKWSEKDILYSELIKVIGRPLYFQKNNRTYFMNYIKETN